jgi:hypothetical protein
MSRDRDTYDLFSPPERCRFGDNEFAAPKNGGLVTGASDLVDLELVFHTETFPGDKNKGAACVSDNGDDRRGKWIPKKFAEIERSGRFVPGTNQRGQGVQLEAVKLTIPQWLAREKGLL